MFNWKGKSVVMRPLLPTPKPTKERESKFISMCNQDKFLVESKERKPRFALVVKEGVTPPIEILKKMRLLLEEFKSVVHDELPEGLAPMKDILHYNDLILKASVLNLPQYWIHPKEGEVLKRRLKN